MPAAFLDQQTPLEQYVFVDVDDLSPRCTQAWMPKNAVIVNRAAFNALDKPTQAILTVMLLRGPQTLSELLTRTQRMYEFKNTEEIQEKKRH